MNLQFLKRGQILNLPKQGLFLRVSKGKVWATRENDNEDYVLLEGDYFESTSNSMIILEALEDTTVYYSAQKPDFNSDVRHTVATAAAGARSAEATTTGIEPRSASAR